MSVTESIQKLKELDLSVDQYKAANLIFDQLGKFAVLKVRLHPGKMILRMRANHGTERYFSKCALSYRPQQFNNDFQRASTPYKTMFYGSIQPDNPKPDEAYWARLTCAAETIPEMLNTNATFIQKVTAGRWQVTEDIVLAAIIQNPKYYDASKYIAGLVDAYIAYTSGNDEISVNSKLVTDFFAEEYGKEQINNHFSYQLSAIFSERLSMQVDGVIYPSVKSIGKGLNIALLPEIADNKIALVGAVEGTIYKKNASVIYDNDAVVYLGKNQLNFDYSPITNPKERMGYEKSLQHIDAIPSDFG